jgi:RimJ/RimL family protein N-acetyltransferase
MAEADLAIGGAGTSTWERCCLGLPSISIRLAENQSTIARNVAVAGAAVDLGDISSLDRLALVEAIRRLRDPPTRREMAAAAARICDGLGARRAVGHLIPERSADGRAVTLRPATEDDAKAMFEWQQDPAIRRFAHRPEPPTWQEHTEWLARRLAQPDAGLFSVVMSDRTPVGVVRLDGVDGEGESFVVNVFVDRAWQRRGIAAAALRACRRIIGAATLTAEVHPDNVASHRLFRRAGFSEPAPGRYRQSVAALGSAAERR